MSFRSSIFTKIIHRNVFTQIKLNDKPVSGSTNISILSFVVLFLFIFLIGAGLLVVTGIDPVTAASASVTSLGNIGPGLGTNGPMSNFAHKSEISKLVCSFLMIIGRLEVYTIFILFSRSFWKV